MVYRMFPSYVGSKRHYIPLLERFRGMRFIEPFCGSAVLSFNLAGSCFLNDADSKVVDIISNFDKMIVPDVFTGEDYYRVRKLPEWHLYTYVLQSMSFSGVFRYSRNGYNVPMKPQWRNKPLQIQKQYQTDLTRWRNLDITVANLSYDQLPDKLFDNTVTVLDPPYEGSKASYNASGFDYTYYWDWVSKHLRGIVVIFDRMSNLQKRGIPLYSTRPMTVNGKQRGDVEAMAIFNGVDWECSTLIQV